MITCNCPDESTSRRLALDHGLNEYLVIHENGHYRKRLDGSLVAKAMYADQYWHAFLEAVRWEGKKRVA